jgi:NADH-quinone oxidoreductase subunit G
VPPAGLAQSDFEILSQIAIAEGVAFPETLEALHKEMKALSVPPAAARAVTVGSLSPVSSAGLVLATSRRLLDDGTMMKGADALSQTAAPVTIEINPADAAGLRAGETAVLRTARGEVRAPVKLTNSVARGVAFVPAHAGFEGRSGESVQLEKAED